MDNTKFTKGKWRLGLENKQSVVCDKFNGLIPTICRLDTINNLICDEEKEANSLLISKAPEMLEMLKNVQKLMDGNITEQNNMWHKIESLIKQATEI